MEVLERIRALQRNWQAADAAHLALDQLLASADPKAPLAAKNEWLIELGYWLRRKARVEVVAVPAVPVDISSEHTSPSANGNPGDGKNSDTEESTRPKEALTRLKFFLRVLERHPEAMERVAATLQSIVAELDAISLLCETGLAQSPGFWGELRERLAARAIPAIPQTGEWSTLLTLLFPNANDPSWIAEIDADSWRAAQLLLVLPTREGDLRGHGIADVAASLRVLVSQVCATGLNSGIRSRMGLADFAHSPYLPLARAGEELFTAGEGASPDLGDAETLQRLNVFRGCLEECRLAAGRVFEHLEDNGVSVDIEFRVEGILARIARIEMLLEFWLQPNEPEAGRRVLASLVASHQESRSIGALWRQSFARLARKVVDRSAETGEHYITRTRSEYRAMLGAAAGGGAVTVLTVYLKLFITSAHLHRLFEGLAASVNYAASFLLIHFAGFTLATKQPAMTAPALAAKLDGLEKPGGLDAFVEETLSLMRSQVAAVLGNVAAVIPIAYLIQWAFHGIFGANLITPEKAHATIESFSLLGPTPIYAAFTGVLLWLSALVAGWADNWFVYRKIGDVLAYHRRLRFMLGDRRAARLAAFCREHVSGIAGNVSLGFLLGMAPVIAENLALPLEVRHVTLSSGGLAAAVGVLGLSTVLTSGFWLAVLGIVSMAFLNVGVSFFFAFQLALRSRDLPRLERSSIYRAIVRAILTHPVSLFMVTSEPEGASASESHSKTASDSP